MLDFPADWSPGIFENIPADEYHRTILGEANNSGLKILDEKTPLHYKAWVEKRNKPLTADEEFKQAQHYRVGRILHSAVLEPQTMRDAYVTLPDFGPLQSSKNREARDQWLRSLPDGTTVVKQEEIELALSMREAIMQHKLARLVIEGGKSEVTLRWKDERTGVRVKARADFWHEEMGYALDLKSTGDASPFGFGHSAAKFGYTRQHGLYSQGFSAIGAPIKHFLFLAVEKEPPHAVGLYHLDASAEERGFALVQRSLDKMAACIAKDEWPGYSQNIEPLTVPGWHFSD